jgi:hypothetical protein
MAEKSATETAAAQFFPQSRKRPGRISEIPAEWGRLEDVERIVGLKRASIYRILAEEPSAFASFVLKRGPDSKSGARMFFLPSVRRWMKRKFASAKKAQLGTARLAGSRQSALGERKTARGSDQTSAQRKRAEVVSPPAL